MKKLYNVAMNVLQKIERFLLQCVIFLVPTNLALHWYINEAYINGRLVDYFLPKIYLSDLFILVLIIIGIYRYFCKLNTRLVIPFSVIFLVLYLLINSLSSALVFSSTWYVFKVIEYLLFSVYLLKTYTRKSFLLASITPFILAITFQTLIGLYQYINHSSIFGYMLLGEPNLNSMGIARTTIRGFLEVAPYGTTAHPNILAAFLLLSMCFVLLGSHLSPKNMLYKVLIVVLISLSIIIILLTGSITVVSGIIIGLLFLVLYKLVSIRMYILIVLMYICGTLILPLPLLDYFYHNSQLADNPSISTRYELKQTANTLINKSFLTGIGPNQFPLYVSTNMNPGQKTVFLQPVHNTSLLIVAETGLLGFLLILWCFYDYIKVCLIRFNQVGGSYLLSFLPILILLLLGSWDHYPVTQQTGQLLTLFSLVLPLFRIK